MVILSNNQLLTSISSNFVNPTCIGPTQTLQENESAQIMVKHQNTQVLMSKSSRSIKPGGIRGYHGRDLSNAVVDSCASAEAERFSEDGADELAVVEIISMGIDQQRRYIHSRLFALRRP